MTEIHVLNRCNGSQSRRIALLGLVLGGIACGEDAASSPAPNSEVVAPRVEDGGGSDGGAAAEDAGGESALEVSAPEDAAPPPAASSPRAGNWTGVWGMGDYGLSFKVDEEGGVVDITVTDSSPSVCGRSGYVEATEMKRTPLGGDGQFKIVVIGCNDDNGACFNDEIIGKVDVDGNAAGTLRTSGVYNLKAACFGGVSGGSVAWKARRDCTVVPKMGASATRFCPGSAP